MKVVRSFTGHTVTNAAGGVHGHSIRYVVEDAGYQVPNAIRAANKLINRDRVLAMVLAVGTPMNNAIMTEQFEQGVPNLFPISGARSMVEPLHPLKFTPVSYTHLRAHETLMNLVCRLLLEKKKE